MVRMRPPLVQVFEKGTMFTVFYLFIVAYPMLSKQTPAKTSLTKVSKSVLPDPSQVPVIVKSEPIDDESAAAESSNSFASKNFKKSFVQ